MQVNGARLSQTFPAKAANFYAAVNQISSGWRPATAMSFPTPSHDWFNLFICSISAFFSYSDAVFRYRSILARFLYVICDIYMMDNCIFFAAQFSSLGIFDFLKE